MNNEREKRYKKRLLAPRKALGEVASSPYDRINRIAYQALREDNKAEAEQVREDESLSRQ